MDDFLIVVDSQWTKFELLRKNIQYIQLDVIKEQGILYPIAICCAVF